MSKATNSFSEYIKANTAVAVILGAGILAALTIAGAMAYSGHIKPVAETTQPQTKTSQSAKKDDAKQNSTPAASDNADNSGDVAVNVAPGAADQSNGINQTPVTSNAVVTTASAPQAETGDVAGNGGNGQTGNTNQGGDNGGSQTGGDTGSNGGSQTGGNGGTQTGGNTGGQTGDNGGTTGGDNNGGGTSTPVTVGTFTPRTANLVTNPDLTSDSNGYSNYTENANVNKFAFTYEATGGHDGNGFLRTVLTNGATSRYGSTTYGSWSPNEVAIASTGQMYAFSMWYRTPAGTDPQLEVDAQILQADGTYSYPVIGRPLSTNGEWKQFSGSFFVPAGATSVTASAMVLTNGTLDTDNFYLGVFQPTALTAGPMISLTFDDGWASIHNNALPTLNQLGLKSTQYIISGVVNSDPSYMTTANIQDFINRGDEIADHTVNHIPLTDKASLTAAGTSVNAQVGDNKTQLQGLGLTNLNPITDFASPEGEYDSETIAALQANGLLSHRSVEEGFNSPDAGIFNPYDIKVQNITKATTLDDINRWIAEAKATNTWLVIVYHEVTDTPAEGVSGTPDQQYWTSVADFQAQMQAVKDSGVRTVTMSEGLSEINAQIAAQQ